MVVSSLRVFFASCTSCTYSSSDGRIREWA
jgi:hypothetical protein